MVSKQTVHRLNQDKEERKATEIPVVWLFAQFPSHMFATTTKIRCACVLAEGLGSWFGVFFVLFGVFFVVWFVFVCGFFFQPSPLNGLGNEGVGTD